MSQSVKWFALVTCALVVALVAAILDSDALYFLAAFLVVVPLGSWVFGTVSLQSLQVEAGTHVPIFSGDALELPIQVMNPGVIPRFFVRLGIVLPSGLVATGPVSPWSSVEREPSPVPSLAPPPAPAAALPEETSASSEPPETAIARTRSDLASDVVSYVAGHSRAVARVQILTRRRGEYALGPIVLSYLDPIGLTSVSRRVAATPEVLVYPRPLGVEMEPLLGGDLLGSEQTAPSRGAVDGSDFFGLRPYRPGDEWRRVHWRTTARTGTLTVVEREALASLSIAVIVDLESTPGDDEDAPLEVLIRLAAQLAEEGVRRLCSIYLLALSPDGKLGDVAERCVTMDPAMEALARMKLDSVQDWYPTAHLPDHIGRGPSVVILTDRFDTRTEAVIAEIRRNGWPGAVLLYGELNEAASSAGVPVWLVYRHEGHLESEGHAYGVEPLARIG